MSQIVPSIIWALTMLNLFFNWKQLDSIIIYHFRHHDASWLPKLTMSIFWVRASPKLTTSIIWVRASPQTYHVYNLGEGRSKTHHVYNRV